MIKPVITQQPVRLIIMRDGKMIANISMPMADGCIDTDGFKHVESITDPINMCITIRAEV